ncbi:MAG: Rv3235 family protein [Arcanobacterium sp.]|nr:Rv3235 family protein [Arcanobacterium sp.]
MDKTNELVDFSRPLAAPLNSFDLPEAKSFHKAPQSPQQINNPRPKYFEKYPLSKQNRGSFNNFDRIQLHAPRTNNPAKQQDPKEHFAQSDNSKPLTPPDRFLTTIALQIIEVLNGHRPARQLQTWLSIETYETLLRRHTLGMRICGGPQRCTAPYIKRSRIFSPCKGVAEAGLVIFDGVKIRAAALRAESVRAKWKITAIEIV